VWGTLKRINTYIYKYLYLSEQGMQPPRPVEELNSVVVAAIVVVGGGGGCGPQLGRAHGLLSSLQIRVAISHLSKTKTLKQNLFFFFSVIILLTFPSSSKRVWL